ncbi:Uncharacterized protein HA466_0161780 [Hirschfeldia incana]|nr:Uncharacterized protein HA466_0161780 [Hirschfeldia incana]
MQKPSQRTLPGTHSFTIHINDSFNNHQHHNHSNKTFIGFSSSMKLFSKFRKILMKIIFIVPSSSSSATVRRHKTTTDSRSGGERLETPKISCSNSYYSSQSHYSEAISDCIDFFNKSSVSNMSHQEREDKIVHEQDCFYV